jgi:hypothetical protein
VVETVHARGCVHLFGHHQLRKWSYDRRRTSCEITEITKGSIESNLGRCHLHPDAAHAIVLNFFLHPIQDSRLSFQGPIMRVNLSVERGIELHLCAVAMGGFIQTQKSAREYVQHVIFDLRNEGQRQSASLRSLLPTPTKSIALENDSAISEGGRSFSWRWEVFERMVEIYHLPQRPTPRT